MILRRTIFLVAGNVLLVCSGSLFAEASGGSGNGSNDNGLVIARSRTALPWPEPEKAATEKLTAELREELPGFFITRVGPWIVATDLEENEAPRFTQHTIGRYAADIQRQLFTKTPRTEPVKVLLFKDKLSYETWNKKLYNSKPTTPYGYYSRQRKALVMNIATGGGTLLHEMVHAMAEADFGEIPAWLNEGLGSLFEASGRGRGGKVIGVTNWRLTGLQNDLRNNTPVRFSKLLKMSDDEFYGEHSGSNYAASRYLMQWLQEQDKLELFYTRIRDRKDADALATLRAVFNDKLSIEQIEQACYDWVKTLVIQ
ncbi:MAG TPA: DUF1570 domain-containing protein [Planctomycetota bacterium]|nr:DUF1570 domain-containing protein [Planctomycetota bacterium]